MVWGAPWHDACASLFLYAHQSDVHGGPDTHASDGFLKARLIMWDSTMEMEQKFELCKIFEHWTQNARTFRWKLVF